MSVIVVSIFKDSTSVSVYSLYSQVNRIQIHTNRYLVDNRNYHINMSYALYMLGMILSLYIIIPLVDGPLYQREITTADKTNKGELVNSN